MRGFSNTSTTGSAKAATTMTRGCYCARRCWRAGLIVEQSAGGLRLGRPLCLTAGRGDAWLFLLEGSYLLLAWTTFSHQLHGAHQDDRPSSRGDRTNWH